MAIADILYTFVSQKLSYTDPNQPYYKKFWPFASTRLSCDKAKKLAQRYSKKGNLWIAQKLRNNNCSEEFIGRAIGSLAHETERAELVASDKWYKLNYSDNRVRVIKLASYLMAQHFSAEIAWNVARDFGNIH